MSNFLRWIYTSLLNALGFDQSFQFDDFDWDDGNGTKSLVKHGIDKATVQSLFDATPYIADDSRHSKQEKRFVAVGSTPQGRRIIVAFTIRIRTGRRYIRPISARYMHAKEVSRHEKNR